MLVSEDSDQGRSNCALDLGFHSHADDGAKDEKVWLSEECENCSVELHEVEWGWALPGCEAFEENPEVVEFHLCRIEVSDKKIVNLFVVSFKNELHGCVVFESENKLEIILASDGADGEMIAFEMTCLIVVNSDLVVDDEDPADRFLLGGGGQAGLEYEEGLCLFHEGCVCLTHLLPESFRIDRADFADCCLVFFAALVPEDFPTERVAECYGIEGRTDGVDWAGRHSKIKWARWRKRRKIYANPTATFLRRKIGGKENERIFWP